MEIKPLPVVDGSFPVEISIDNNIPDGKYTIIYSEGTVEPGQELDVYNGVCIWFNGRFLQRNQYFMNIDTFNRLANDIRKALTFFL